MAWKCVGIELGGAILKKGFAVVRQTGIGGWLHGVKVALGIKREGIRGERMDKLNGAMG